MKNTRKFIVPTMSRFENTMYRKNRMKITTVRERKRIGLKVTRIKKQIH